MTPQAARRGVPLPRTRQARGWFIAAVVAAVAAIVVVPFALLDDDEGSEQAAESSGEGGSADTNDSDGDGIPDDQDSEPYNNPQDDFSPEAGADETTPEPQQTYRTVGQSATDDGVRFKLLNLEEVQSIPVNEFSDPIVARAGTKLISVRMTVKNDGAVPIDPFCGGANGVVLLDENDRNYEAEDNAIDIAGNDSICSDGIAPGFKDTITLAFEIPPDATIGALTVWNPEAEDDSEGDRDQIVFTP